MIHTGKEAAAGNSAVRKIVVKYLFFKAIAKLENAFKKRPVFTTCERFKFPRMNLFEKDEAFLVATPCPA